MPSHRRVSSERETWCSVFSTGFRSTYCLTEGRAKAAADAIADQLRIRFQDRGWIS